MALDLLAIGERIAKADLERARALPAILPCCHCGKVPEVDPNGGYPVIACDDCYSGPPDFCASGLTRAQAIADWNDRMEQEEPFVVKVTP